MNWRILEHLKKKGEQARKDVRTVHKDLGVGAVELGATDGLARHVRPVEVAREAVDVDADGRLTCETQQDGPLY